MLSIKMLVLNLRKLWPNYGNSRRCFERESGQIWAPESFGGCFSWNLASFTAREMDNEWELSKENVQPLKQGRKFANLSAALQPQASDRMAQIREERQWVQNQMSKYQHLPVVPPSGPSLWGSCWDRQLQVTGAWDHRHLIWNKQNVSEVYHSVQMSCTDLCVLIE